MAATPEQRSTFGQRLREVRSARGMSQPELGQCLHDFGGVAVSGPAVSDWERGVSAPDQQNTFALEDALREPRGSLGGLLGYRGDDPTTAGQISALREEVAALRALVLRLDSAIDAPRGDDEAP